MWNVKLYIPHHTFLIRICLLEFILWGFFVFYLYKRENFTF